MSRPLSPVPRQDGVLDQISRQMLSPQEHEHTRRAVRDLRESYAKQDDVDIAQAVANYIYNHEVQLGSLFLVVDGRPCLFSAITRMLYDIGSNRNWNSHLFAIYGINAKDRLTSITTQFLESHCMWSGEPRTIRRWSAYENETLYLSNYDGNVWRIDGAGVVIDDETGRVVDDGWGELDEDGNPLRPPIGIGVEPNGANVVFSNDDKGVPVPEPFIGRNGKLFKLIGNAAWARDTMGHLQPKHQARALLIWLFAIAFPDFMPTKPILIVEGAIGSGKTSLLQVLQAAVHGSHGTVIVSKNGERDFRVKLMRTPIAILDNADDYIDWMPNSIAAYATGAGWTDRELFTNLGVVEIKPQSFIAVPSKNPTSFRVDDVADRSIVLRMERRKNFRQLRELLAEVGEHRASIYGEYIYYLNRIVAVLKRGNFPTSEHRMADFEAFAHAVGRAFNWKPHVIPDLIHALQRERTAFGSENDVVVELLEQWIEQSGNTARKVTARQLFNELRMLAEYDGKTFLKTPLALAQRLRAPHVQDKFMIEDSLTDRTGRKLYQIDHQLAFGEVTTN